MIGTLVIKKISWELLESLIVKVLEQLYSDVKLLVDKISVYINHYIRNDNCNTKLQLYVIFFSFETFCKGHFQKFVNNAFTDIRKIEIR